MITDYDRRLTMHGHEQARTMGEFCCERELVPEIILTSPVVRAKQTAEGVVAVLQKGEIIEAPWMACGMHPERALQELRAYKTFKSVMIVGHEPDLSGLVAVLLGISNPAALEIAKASLTTLELKKMEVGGAILKWTLPVELIGPKK